MHLLLLVLLALPTCVLTCGYGYDAWFDGRCFKSWNYGQTFHSTAVQQCALSNGHPPIIRSAEDNERVHSMVRKTAGIGATTPLWFWLDLTCNGADFVWSDGSVANYTNFGYPTDCTPALAGKLFFFMTDDLVWNQSGDTIFGIDWIVCEQTHLSASKCDDFEEVPNTVDECYVLKTAASTAYSAERSCNMIGTHLASIHSQAMNDFMRRTAVANNFLSGMHIGMTKANYINFTWLDKSPIDYSNFGQSQPDDSQGACAKITTDTVAAPWVTEDCMNGNLPYFCTKKAVILSDPQQPDSCPTNAQYKAGDNIYSPAFPAPGGSALCNYRIGEADISKKVQLDILFFESNTCCDVLTIFDTDGTVLSTVSGYHGLNTMRFRAKGNTMTLRWNATNGVNVRGFHAVAGSFE